MEFRLAAMQDLPALKSVYKDIVRCMHENGLDIWDDIYPCEFLEDDIRNMRLYILTDHDVVLSAFALDKAGNLGKGVHWQDDRAEAIYMDRLGVNTAYAGKGIGSQMLAHAIRLAKQQGAAYLRLFVVTTNQPAIALYEKNHFIRAKGLYRETIDDALILDEYGYEIKL